MLQKVKVGDEGDDFYKSSLARMSVKSFVQPVTLITCPKNGAKFEAKELKGPRTVYFARVSSYVLTAVMAAGGRLRPPLVTQA